MVPALNASTASVTALSPGSLLCTSVASGMASSSRSPWSIQPMSTMVRLPRAASWRAAQTIHALRVAWFTTASGYASFALPT